MKGRTIKDGKSKGFPTMCLLIVYYWFNVKIIPGSVTVIVSYVETVPIHLETKSEFRIYSKRWDTKVGARGDTQFRFRILQWMDTKRRTTFLQLHSRLSRRTPSGLR